MEKRERRFSAWVKVGAGNDEDAVQRGVYLPIDDYGESAERNAIEVASRFISTLFQVKRELSQFESKLLAEHPAGETYVN